MTFVTKLGTNTWEQPRQVPSSTVRSISPRPTTRVFLLPTVATSVPSTLLTAAPVPTESSSPLVDASTVTSMTLCPSFDPTCPRQPVEPNSKYCRACTHLYLCSKYGYPRFFRDKCSPRIPACCTHEEAIADLRMTREKTMHSKLQSLIHNRWPPPSLVPPPPVISPPLVPSCRSPVLS